MDSYLERRFICDCAHLARQVVHRAKESGNTQTIGLAESCTGGLVSFFITGVPGSSTVYAGGIVSYSNDVKESVLGVSRATLLSYGAVSRETAIEMARGVRQRLNVDVGLSVTGIAGPGGGSAEKPVGLVYVAVCSKEGREIASGLCFPDLLLTRRFLLQGS